MRDKEIDDILNQAAQPSRDLDPALLDRISSSLGLDLQPVKPLAPFWVLAIRLVLVAVTVGIAGATVSGAHGFHLMTKYEVSLILTILFALTFLAAASSVAEAIPGSRRPLSPMLLGISACLLLAAAFTVLFHDLRSERFVAQGIKCLAAGLGYAVPTAGAVWWLLRRGVMLNLAAAGFARGILAGLAGVVMLELHCPNLELPHMVVWHISVLPISGLIGICIARWRSSQRAFGR